MDFVDFSLLDFLVFAPLAGLVFAHLRCLAGHFWGLASPDVFHSQCFLCEVKRYFEVNDVPLASGELLFLLSCHMPCLCHCSLWPWAGLAVYLAGPLPWYFFEV